MQSEPLIEKLDELIAATKAASFSDRWLDAVGVGALLGQTPRYVLEHFAPRPDFPKALRIGQPRWKASEVLAWAEKKRDEHKGRPRKVNQAA